MIITKKRVTEQKRTSHTARLFGLNFPMRLEPAVYGLTENLSEDYSGGYWDFWELSNGGFYMSPSSQNKFKVSCMNDLKLAATPPQRPLSQALHGLRCCG
jgi:hypothetical protein